MTDYVTYLSEQRSQTRELSKELSEVMQGFNALHKASLGEGALSTAEKELIALGIGIAARCQGCIAFHVAAALRAGCSHAQIQEAIGVAILMGGGPAMIYGAEALKALKDLGAEQK